MGLDNYYEEVNNLELQNILTNEKEQEQQTSSTPTKYWKKNFNKMEIEGFESLPKLFVSQTEKMMDEFTSSVKELRGLIKILKSYISNLLFFHTPQILN